MKRERIDDCIFEGGKSFFIYSRNRSICYDCGYCVLESVDYLKRKEKFRDIEIGLPPAKINPILKTIPVAVNNSYGDPGLQWNNTLEKLSKLEKTKHQGPVGIVTKSRISENIAERIADFNLKVICLISLSLLPKEIESVEYESRLEGIKNCRKKEIPILIYYRPIIPNFNDSRKKIRKVLTDIAKLNVNNIVYSGLMGKKEVINKLERRVNQEIVPPKEHTKWQENHKLISDKKRKEIEHLAQERDIETFRKTSCGVINTLGMHHDYNMHFLKPEKYNCNECPNLENCISFANQDNQKHIKEILKRLGLKGKISHREEEKECKLKEVCNNSCTNCQNSKGTTVTLKGEYTQGLIGIVRWLIGANVTAEKVITSHQIPNKEIKSIYEEEKATIYNIQRYNKEKQQSTVG